MHLTRRQTTWYGLALVLVVGMIVGYFLLSRTASTLPPSAGMNFNPKTCGQVALSTVTIGRNGQGTPRQVATFYPWQCPGKPASCEYSGNSHAYPDTACSPGAIYDLTGNTDPARYDEAANRSIICETTTDGRRNVTDRIKKKVYAQYGVERHTALTYEMDHIVSLTLGGSNSAANLYPQPASPQPGFHQKDAVESALGRAVCKGTITLQAAQGIIAHRWVEYFNEHNLTAPHGAVG